MYQPLVSIGLPVYNSGKFLSIAIQSVLKQTYENFELIITDDGSTDNSDAIIRSFNDKRIKYISDSHNKGISFRLNQQIEMAKGEYFCRMDGDDIMLPWRLEEQIKYLINNPHVDIIGSGAYVIDDDNKIIGQRGRHDSYNLTLTKLYAGCAFIHPTVIGKTDIFRRLKYIDKLKGVEDMDFWYRAASLSVIMKYVPLQVLCYREPLKMKLGTYLFRQKQTRKFWKSDCVTNFFSDWACKKSIIRSYLKSLIAIVCCLASCDSKLIARRNLPVELSSTETIFIIQYISNLSQNLLTCR